MIEGLARRALKKESKVEFPDDADGDALRRVQANGSNMARPMDIDFHVTAPDGGAAEAIAAQARAQGFAATATRDDEVGAWTSTCTLRMVPAHDQIIAIQARLDELSRPFGGETEGWGTFGNKGAA